MVKRGGKGCLGRAPGGSLGRPGWAASGSQMTPTTGLPEIPAFDPFSDALTRALPPDSLLAPSTLRLSFHAPVRSNSR